MIDPETSQADMRRAFAWLDRICSDGSISVVMIEPDTRFREIAERMWGWDGVSTVWKLKPDKARELADFFRHVGFLDSFIRWLAEPKPVRMVVFMQGFIQAVQGDPRTGGFDVVEMMPDGWCLPGEAN